MASLAQGIYSVYMYHNRLVSFERKSSGIILMKNWKKFENFFDTNMNISFKFYCAE